MALAGYDMQFDIKYAYLNFLQSIHYPVLKSTMLKIECEGLEAAKPVLKTNSSEDEVLAGVS